MLTLQNNEATLRVKKLINTCISLKDYAMNVERNMNNTQLGLGQLNNSMFIPNTGFNINNTLQQGKYSTSTFQNIQGNDLNLNKILNDDELNQTY